MTGRSGDRAPLVTIAGDGTWRPGPSEDGRPLEPVEARLAALVRLRSLLGDDLEELIATRLHLPMALGTESADQLLPATLSLLAGTSGDLASYGWRLGTGASRAWHRARELRERTIEDARIALLGYEGPLATTVLGPATLAAATHLPSGERSLADRGAVRDLPIILGEGILGQIAALAERVPGARPCVLVRDGAAAAVHAGRVPTASGYRRHAALDAAALGGLWEALLDHLAHGGIDPAAATLLLPPDPCLLAAARTAGWRRLAFAVPEVPSLTTVADRALWERIAVLREDGAAIELAVDPARVTDQLDGLARTWRGLGYAPRDLCGLTLIASPRASVSASDPAREPGRSGLLTPEDLERVLRVAPEWTERVAA